ncbi:MAG: rRNA pseudouridine synthase [Firmicutes bacterium]|nr:rRNA pseudouridine synthase [Bacillota bacterium]
MRINKYIAQAGVASRRKADELIAAGNVKVNGVALREPGYDVVEGDVVEVNGRRIQAEEKKVYILLNKPIGYVTTVSDDKERPTVMDLVRDVDARIFPVGRLDYNTSGMLIMTNDGDFAYKVTHPKHELTKTYRARVAGILSNEKCAKLRKGVDIGGFITSRAKVEIIKGLPRSTVVDITIHEGKNRQVRKMFKAVGNNVQELERIAIGDIRLGRLAVGHYRKLTREEVEYLKNC